jgi:hypothetical protein
MLSPLPPGSDDCVTIAALAELRTGVFCHVGFDIAWTMLDRNLPLYLVTLFLHFGGSRFLAIYNGKSGGLGAISI